MKYDLIVFSFLVAHLLHVHCSCATILFSEHDFASDPRGREGKFELPDGQISVESQQGGGLIELL